MTVPYTQSYILSIDSSWLLVMLQCFYILNLNIINFKLPDHAYVSNDKNFLMRMPNVQIYSETFCL